jgi:hypothetical protein
MAYEITIPRLRSRAGLGTPEVDPFVSYDAAMAKIQRNLYWILGLSTASIIGVGALFLTRLGR